MLRPHQSLELVEIMKKFARTWGCKLDLTDFAPPERTQSPENPRVQHVVSVGVMQHPRKPACADLPVRVSLGTRLCPVSDRVRVSSSCDLLDLLGFKRKQEKEHSPADSTPLLGILVTFHKSAIRMSTQPQREARLSAEVRQILRDDFLFLRPSLQTDP